MKASRSYASPVVLAAGADWARVGDVVVAAMAAVQTAAIRNRDRTVRSDL
jgi:hypothetical protein